MSQSQRGSDAASGKVCDVGVCDRPVYCRGWCKSHYLWSYKHDGAAPTHAIGSLRPDHTGRPCSVDGCDRMARTKGYCEPHYVWSLKHGGAKPTHRLRGTTHPCPVEGCDRMAKTTTYCRRHDEWSKKHGGAVPTHRIVPSVRYAAGTACSVEVCDRPVFGRSLCSSHWAWSKNNGWAKPTHRIGDRPGQFTYPEGQTCSVDACDNPVRVRGYCQSHYNWSLNHDGAVPTHAIGSLRPDYEGVTCKVEVCDKRVRWKGLCGTHAAWSRANGGAIPTHAIGSLGREWDNEVCRVEVCDLPAKTVGMCVAHYSWYRKHDKQVPTHALEGRIRGDDDEATKARLRRYYSLDPDTGCWVWTGPLTAGGYGQVTNSEPTKGNSRLAHRAAYEVLVGPIPEGMHLDHLCRNRACFNPEHLEPVEPVENSRRGLNYVRGSIDIPIPPLDIEPVKKGSPLLDRVLERSVVDPYTGCWLWTGPKDKDGYGRITVTTPLVKRPVHAHRITWALLRGPLATDQHIDHLCRVRACCNPDHLEPVSNAENARRRVEVQKAIGVEPRIGRKAA